MKRTLVLLMLLSTTARASGKMPVVYAPGDVPARTFVRQNQLFEKGGEIIAAYFKLPRDIPIVVGHCGAMNAFYDPERVRIVVCDEMIEFMITAAPGPDRTARSRSWPRRRRSRSSSSTRSATR
jgi:hypothetical protein